MREQKRQSRRTAGRVGAGGLGAERRARRREGARQTLNELDQDVFKADRGSKEPNQRVTLNLSVSLAKRLVEILRGSGLRASERGELEVALGESLGLDSEGRVSAVAGDSIDRLVDSTGGTVDADGEITGANANGMATLLAKLNELLDALSVGKR